MDTTKLKSLLNKVVEFHRPDEIYCKGFLYRDVYNDKYYIKVVEIMLGKLTFNQKYFLKEGDEEFIVKAEKPKLMRVSMKSWHYRLVKFVLRDNAPTPKTMQNGCPYFYLVIFSALVLVFVLLWKGFKLFLNLFPMALEALVVWMVESWIERLDDMDAYNVYRNSALPVTGKMYFNDSEEEFFNHYLTKKYGFARGSEEWGRKKDEMSANWKEWRDKRDAKKSEQRQKIRERRLEREEKRAEREMIREKRMKPINDALSNIGDKFNAFGRWCKKTFTVPRGGVNAIVKRTKQFMGAVITLTVLFVTFFVVNYLALALMWFIDLCIAYWYVLVVIVALGAAIGVLYVLYIFITSWVQKIVNKYQRGKKVWYIEPLTWIFLLVKGIVVVVAYAFYYIIIIPIKFIFYDVLWKIILVPVGTAIGRFFVWLGKGLLSSTGIFGEYFGASYSDFCPGLEWVDTDED